jgi:hypothetical protein
MSRFSNFKAVYIPNIEEESIEASIINNKERQQFVNTKII